MIKITFDITRSLHRTLLGRLPTGVDRVVLEYISHFSQQSQALVRIHSRWIVLSVADSARIFLGLHQPCPRFQLFARYFVAKSVCKSTAALQQRRSFLIHAGHSGLEKAAYVKRLQRIKARPIFFVHDLIPITHPAYCRPGELARHQARMRTILQYGRGVIVNSQATFNELERFALAEALPMPPTVVAWLAAANLPLVDSPRPLSEPYFIMLGTIEARKNHAFILQLWRQLVERFGADAPKLVIIGQRGWECENALDLLERCDVLRSHVLEIGRCSDAELASYLKHGQALLFPSFAEGFGMPIVEAFSQKLPVLCSDLPAFREIAGDIPEYLNPLDGLGWMTLIEQYSVDTHPMRLAQLARLVKFQPPTWAAHFAVVDDLLARIDAGED